jgi:hypothetical protein
MATTTNYSWTTPDDTALVKDGAAAIRTLGSSADTTVKALNPGTTAGDIDYYTTSTAKARVGIGTAGQVLTVNSGATAPEWATPATPTTGANWSLLNAGGTALTGAQTITVSGISGKDKIMVLIEAGSSASAGSTITMRLNADSGSNYGSMGFKMEVGSTYSTNLGNVKGGLTATSWEICKMASNAASNIYVGAIITGCNAAGVKVIQTQAGVGAGGGSAGEYPIFAGFWNNSATVTSVSVISGAGNWDSGTIYIYTSAS